jgi:hypothetical protein
MTGSTLALGLGLLVLAGTARADDVMDAAEQQGIGADLGIAAGGSNTPGGLRIAGHYLYQLSDHDFFDGTAAFTYGSGAAGCFDDRSGSIVCEHGLLAGTGAEITAAVRRYFAVTAKLQPFARVGVGVQLVHYSGDALTGVMFPLHLGGGVRATVAPGIAIVGQGEVTFGFGKFGDDLGVVGEIGLAVTAGVEFRLK